MDYLAHYNALILRGQNRVLEGYKEHHHIVPVCMGGTDDESNLVALTGREHFVAHQLLVKLYPKVGGLIAAVRFLTSTRQGNPVKSRIYEWLRKRHAIQMSINNKGKKMTPEQIAKAAASHLGKKRSVEARANMSRGAKLRKMSDEGKKSLSEARQKQHAERRAAGIPHPNEGRKMSEETKKMVSESLKGRKNTPEHLAKRVAARNATYAARRALAGGIL